MKMEFEIGKTYACMLNGGLRNFKVLGNGVLGKNGKEIECFIRWDDGDEEWAYIKDMQRWTQEALII